MRVSVETVLLSTMLSSLMACASSPLGAVDAAAGGGDLASSVVQCGTGVGTFPTFDRACNVASDCFIALHQKDCCGSRVALGLRQSERARFDAAEALCQSQYPSCRCAALPTVADDGHNEQSGPIVVGCTNGSCRTSVAASCGGFGGRVCPSSELCELPAGTCGAADESGVCVPRPVGCDKIYKPVCGCDGKTYGNDCERQVSGTSLLHEGTCDMKACGGSTSGYCSGNLGCSCCPAGGPTEHCVCSTPCVKDAECTDPARPVCTAPSPGQMGFCAEKGFTCCWLCQ